MDWRIGVCIGSVGFLGCAQTNWPSDIRTLAPEASASPVAAVVPANPAVLSPKLDVPPEQAKWSGTWSGFACQGRVCDTKLVVERVTNDDATIIYAFASGSVNQYATRVEAKFVGGELRGALGNGATIAYRMRESGDVEFLYYRSDSDQVWGVLSRGR